MRNRLKWYFDQTSSDDEFSNPDEFGDLAKIVAILNKSLSPHISAKVVGDEAVIRCKNKTVWIDQNCLVTGETSAPYFREIGSKLDTKIPDCSSTPPKSFLS